MTCVNRIIWQKIFLLNNIKARLAVYSKKWDDDDEKKRCETRLERKTETHRSYSDSPSGFFV